MFVKLRSRFFCGKKITLAYSTQCINKYSLIKENKFLFITQNQTVLCEIRIDSSHFPGKFFTVIPLENCYFTDTLKIKLGYVKSEIFCEINGSYLIRSAVDIGGFFVSRSIITLKNNNLCAKKLILRSSLFGVISDNFFVTCEDESLESFFLSVAILYSKKYYHT